MKQIITIFVANRELNALMWAFDLKPDYKWFVTPQRVSFNGEISSDALMKMIDASKNNTAFWIPAIAYMNNWFFDASVHELSDGERIIFCGHARNASQSTDSENVRTEETR